MSGDQPDNRDAERAFGGETPPSGADAFGQGAYQPPAPPDVEPTDARPAPPDVEPAGQPPAEPQETHGGWAPPALPGGEPIAPAPPPPPPPPADPATTPGHTATWPPLRDPATSAGHSSTWPPPDPGVQLRTADGATASLVLGIISWVICPIICSVPAIILARQARAEIDRSPTPLAGKDNASAGFWLGVSSLIVYGAFTIYLIIDAAAQSG
jgi:hypothetical protein